MRKNLFTFALLGSTAALPMQSIAKQKTEQNKKDKLPNVIVILADDLGYGDLQCYGAKGVETPNINRLARNGIQFTNGHAIAATSTPSRYSLLTGEYAWRRNDTDIAAGNASMIIHPEQFTMADMFRSRGYTTAAIGKWHLGLGSEAGEQDWNAPLPTECLVCLLKTEMWPTMTRNIQFLSAISRTSRVNRLVVLIQNCSTINAQVMVTICQLSTELGESDI